jgi:CubicO group peptidase (beta-lactamase class C family)
VASLFPDWKDLDPEWSHVTLEMLLSHRGGLPHDPPPSTWKQMWSAKDPVKERGEAVHQILRTHPTQVGEFAYSNAGYMVAGHMLERAGGGSWESLLQTHVFAKLGMRSCGFGPPAHGKRVDQPWAHRLEKGKLLPAPPEKSDNPLSLGPAGTVHCSLDDWAKFARAHLRAGFVQPETLTKLHLPIGDYALGWGFGRRQGLGVTLSHDGSNTMFYASILLLPEKGRAFLAATNRAGDDAARAMHEIIDFLVDSTR